MIQRITTIARYTLLEALRTRLPQLLAAVVLLLGGASLFVQQIAITEGARMQAGIYAAGMRLAAVFMAVLYVLASITREFNDKGLDIALALDLPRGHYILGKLAGFLVIGLGLAAVASLPLAFVAGPEAALQWGASLALELGILIALAVFCMVTFRQFMAAASFVMAFYLLARALTAIRLMSAGPLVDADAPGQRVIQLLVEGLALVIPALDRWTQTAWLVNEQAAWTDIATLAWRSALYIILLTAAAMFDFYRREW